MGTVPLGVLHPGDHCTQGITAPRGSLHPGQAGQRRAEPEGREGPPPAGHAGEGITNIFIFFNDTQKHVFLDSCQNANIPVRCTALWTQINLNP